jgi:alpha 1,6-mannosyltransferase
LEDVEVITSEPSMDDEIVDPAKFKAKSFSSALEIVQALSPLTLKYVRESDLPTRNPIDFSPINGEHFIWDEHYIFLGPNNIKVPEEWVTRIPKSDASFVKQVCQESEVLCTAIKFSLNPTRVISKTQIPAIVHQSWKLPYSENARILQSVNTFKDKNPDYLHLYWLDSDVAAFIKYFHPEILSMFETLHIKVMRSDIFRYLVLYRFGGVWSDTDTLCLKPIDNWVKLPPGVEPGTVFSKNVKGTELKNMAGNVKVLVALELDYMHMDRMYPGRESYMLEEEFGYPHPASIVQWTFAGASGHSILKDASLNAIRNTIYYESLSDDGRVWLKANRHQDLGVLKFTGPGMFSKVVHSHLTKKTGMNWRQLSDLEEEFTAGDDLHIFTVTGFSAGHTMPMGYKDIDDPRALVKHLFAGSWK